MNRTVDLGTPTPGPISWAWNAPPGRVMLSVDNVPGATSYEWYVDGVLKATTIRPSYNLPMNGNVSCGNSYYFGVVAAGNCGNSLQPYIIAEMPPCEFPYTVSPNPSSDNVRIEINNSEMAKANTKKSAEIQEVELYDKMGLIKRKQKFGKGQTAATISVVALPNDVYTLRIFDGKIWQSCKIIIQH